MFQNTFVLLSESVTVLSGLCVVIGIAVYLGFRYWQDLSAFFGSRSQLLSVGALLAILIGVLQFCQFRDDAEYGDLQQTAETFPHPQSVTAESLNAQGLAVVATYHNDNARTGQNTLETVL